PAHPLGLHEDRVRERAHGCSVVPGSLRSYPQSTAARPAYDRRNVFSGLGQRHSGRLLVDGEIPGNPGFVPTWIVGQYNGFGPHRGLLDNRLRAQTLTAAQLQRNVGRLVARGAESRTIVPWMPKQRHVHGPTPGTARGGQRTRARSNRSTPRTRFTARIRTASPTHQSSTRVRRSPTKATTSSSRGANRSSPVTARPSNGGQR